MDGQKLEFNISLFHWKVGDNKTIIMQWLDLSWLYHVYFNITKDFWIFRLWGNGMKLRKNSTIFTFWSKTKDILPCSFWHLLTTILQYCINNFVSNKLCPLWQTCIEYTSLCVNTGYNKFNKLQYGLITLFLVFISILA